MNKQMRLAIALPLIGLHVAWVTFMISIYVGLTEENFGTPQEVRLSTYLILIAIALFSVFASIGHSRADKLRLEAGADNHAANAAFRFATLSVIIGLVVAAIFAIVTFLSSFGGGFNTTVTGRIFGVYVPIILAAALVVIVLLRATVFRKSSDVDSGDKGKLTEQQKALILGYSVPVLGTALAIILGIIFYDAQGRSLDIWAWVVIQVIIGLSIILGTRFAARARAGKPAPVRPRTTMAGAAGAVSLNFVLSVIFGTVVTFMSFGFGADAVSQLRDYRTSVDGYQTIVTPITADWFFNNMLPAYLLLSLASIGVYISLVSRHSNTNASAARGA